MNKLKPAVDRGEHHTLPRARLTERNGREGCSRTQSDPRLALQFEFKIAL